MDRIQITFFGPANSGKSTLVNAICGQEVSLVSPVPGTTTDPVRKIIELPFGIGPAVLVDTAGYGDESTLGGERERLTRSLIESTDVAVLLETGHPADRKWKDMLSKAGVAVVSVDTSFVPDGEGVSRLLKRISENIPGEEQKYLTGNLVKPGDTVLLVMPQDSEAPKGRLILPQVNVLRELLDRGCNALCTTPSTLSAALERLSSLPELVITDSQVFGEVDAILPEECPLTSFSVLLAAAKGDMPTFLAGAGAIDSLGPGSRVLIAEACSHVPDTEDIGRVKIPALLRKKAGELTVEIAAGNDFPEDISSYDLIIHCGACVASRRLVQSRTRKALLEGVPITNYGLAIAKLKGILGRISVPV